MATRGVNKVILIGNVGQDPEVRFTPNGVAIANVRLATSESWKDQSGQLQERTEWHRVVMYRRLAEIVGEYVKKGSKIYIEGKLTTRKWQDKEGQDRYTTEVVADEMQMLDGRPGGEGGGRQGGGGYQGNAGGGNYPQGNSGGGNWGGNAAAAAPAAAAAGNWGGGDAPARAPAAPAAGNRGNYGNAPAQQPGNFAEPTLDFDDDIPF